MPIKRADKLHPLIRERWCILCPSLRVVHQYFFHLAVDIRVLSTAGLQKLTSLSSLQQKVDVCTLLRQAQENHLVAVALSCSSRS